MIVDELKNAILNLSTEGKLVEQKENEDAHQELIKILSDEKENKRYKYVEIIDYPFNIPKSWVWIKLEDICTKITDGTHSTPKYSLEGIPFLSVKDISSGKIKFENTKFIEKEEHDKLYVRCNPEYGDILISKVGTTGVPAIVDCYEEFSLFVSVALLKFNKTKINNKFLYYFLLSPIVQKQVKDNTRGVGNKNWVLDAIKNTILPLPPIEEQQRIVNKIEELFARLDEIKPIEEELKFLKENFPNDMINSILNDAYTGKLTNQNASVWNSNKLIDCCKEIVTGNSISESIKKSKYTNIKEGYNYIATKDLEFDHTFNYDNGIKIPFDEKGFKYARENDILICIEGGSAGKKIGILNETVCYGNKLCRFSANQNILPKFLYYYLQSPIFLKNFNSNLSGIIGGVSINKIKNIEFKYPSIEAQQRIVEKIEQLLPLCDDIKNLVNE